MDQDGRLGISGSLPKYWKGSNVETFKRTELIQAIGRLAYDTGVDPDAARVFKLDLGASLALERSVSDYFPILGHRSRFTRKDYGDGVAYESKLRSLTFYDKGKEANRDSDLLRIELKLKTKLRYQLRWPVFLSDLYDEARFESLVFRWRKEYEAVQKISRHTLTTPLNMKDFRDQLARLGVEATGGQEAVFAHLRKNDVDRNTRRSCKRYLKRLCETGNSPVDARLIEELDCAVERTVSKALQG